MGTVLIIPSIGIEDLEASGKETKLAIESHGKSIDDLVAQARMLYHASAAVVSPYAIESSCQCSMG
jgi:hypothetical protein